MTIERRLRALEGAVRSGGEAEEREREVWRAFLQDPANHDLLGDMARRLNDLGPGNEEGVRALCATVDQAVRDWREKAGGAPA